MDFVEKTSEGRVVLEPKGKLNLVTSSSVKTRVDELIRGGSSRIVIDLSSVDFIDSSGLGALIGSLKTARQAGGDMRIAAAGEQVRAVLRLTNLDRILAPYETVEEASRGW